MTGDRVRAIRTAMGLSARAFGELVGSNTSTVYRWEHAPEARMDPHQARILALLDARMSSGEKVLRRVAGAIAGGGMFALYLLLTDEFGPGARRARREVLAAMAGREAAS